MNKFVYASKLYLKRNSATILTVAGGIGVVGTAVLAVKATPKAQMLLAEAKAEKGEDLTKLEIVKTAGPAYIPAVAAGVGSIACIFGANILNKRQQASMASAYALLDRSYKEYKNKVVEMLGEDGAKEITTEIAKDKYNELDDHPREDDDKLLFYDEFSERYFNADIETVYKAELEINRRLSSWYGASVNEWYELLDIPAMPEGDKYGWASDMLMAETWNSWLHFEHDKVVMDDGLECTIIRTHVAPFYDFQYY